MRTIDRSAKYIKNRYPESEVTKNAIRRWVTSGVLPSVKVGNKYLISMETLEAFLSGDMQNEVEQTPSKIRKIK